MDYSGTWKSFKGWREMKGGGRLVCESRNTWFRRNTLYTYCVVFANELILVSCIILWFTKSLAGFSFVSKLYQMMQVKSKCASLYVGLFWCIQRELVIWNDWKHFIIMFQVISRYFKWACIIFVLGSEHSFTPFHLQKVACKMVNLPCIIHQICRYIIMKPYLGGNTK